MRDKPHLLQTTSFFVPIWVLAAWRLFTGAFFVTELLLEGLTTRERSRGLKLSFKKFPAM